MPERITIEKEYRKRIMSNGHINIDDVNIILQDHERINRLKEFFNGDNILTKSEYKQKIMENKE